MTHEEHTLAEAAAEVRAGRVTSGELVEEALARAERYDDRLGVFLARFDERAREAAAAADAAVGSGEPLGPLHGVPIGVKDILATEEGPSTAQSRVMEGIWDVEEAAAVRRLRRAGAIVVGKTSTLEFAYGLPDSTLPFPVPANPWDASRWPGGSSSGSGAGVAAGMMLGALGTDTGGSVRVPAAMCGITGHKPTTGLVDDRGLVPLAHSVDTIGPMARTARDCALMLEVLTGSPAAPPLDRLDGVRVGVATMAEVAGDGADPAVPERLAAAVDHLERLGASVVAVTLPLHDVMVDASFLTIAAERLSWHRPLLPDSWDRYGASAREGITRAAHYSAADYVQAQRVRRQGQLALAALFDTVDVVVSPMCSRTAPPLGDIGECMRTWKSLVHAPYWNSAGNPAASVPIGFAADGMPLGLQIAGRPFEDALVLQVAEAYQRVTDWHTRRPDLSAIDAAAPGSVAGPLRPPALDTVDPTDAALARALLERAGIVPSDGDVATVAASLGAAHGATQRLWEVACGDLPGALGLGYPGRP
ncbi:amidase [Nocardioides sp. YIM 152315]|uniref:amidase n=1 Tax=Nocardioides sp. YIM 152315 TaxID=3031760 RepID=UPI0023DB064B|nr:amidase [Nocardioides sp. YIM 152315]MDF1604095.1 amidase [Nocardioides sp. YIM 152315]